MDPIAILEKRRSVRAYTDEAVTEDILRTLRAEVSYINSHFAGLRYQLVLDDADPFKGFDRSYGSFKNARNYLASVVDPSSPDAYERAGYAAEQFVTTAVLEGLGTCFVGGTYRKGSVKAQLRAGEKVLFIVLFGFPADKERLLARATASLFHLKKRDWRDLFEPRDELDRNLKSFPELESGLKAVMAAPSSMNKRPVRLRVQDGVLEAGVANPSVESLVDLGIAKYNFNFATGTECEWGNWAPVIIR